jgi:hypothetical protein
VHNERCALCKREGELRESHLFAKALYKLTREENGPHDRLLITPEKTIQSSHQTTCRLLCDACEDRISKRGERTVLAECARSATSFILRDKLRSESPYVKTPSSAWFSKSRLKSVDVESYRYFVASILWRASVGKWRGITSPAWQGLLGSYEEEFRLYLAAPPGTSLRWPLLVAVMSDDDPVRFFSGPVQGPLASCNGYNFYVSGMHFFMFVGDSLDPSVSALFTHAASDTIFELKPQSEHSPLTFVRDMVRNSPPGGRVRDL